MVRVISQEGARILENYEGGSFPNTEEMDWWSLRRNTRKYISGELKYTAVVYKFK